MNKFDVLPIEVRDCLASFEKKHLGMKITQNLLDALSLEIGIAFNIAFKSCGLPLKNPHDIVCFMKDGELHIGTKHD